MKLRSALLALGACASVAHAQYFSSGWTPGQATTKAAAPQATGGFDPRAAPPQPKAEQGPQLGFVDRILTSGPLAGLFSQAGVNITAALEAAHKAAAEIWDMRIPLVTDANFKELIENEEFASEEEERNRVWFLIITAQSGSEPMSKYADNVFDKTYNTSLAAGDIPHVRFGRINYLDVTYITTKWSVWRAPYLVVATDRGRKLRFYRQNTIRMDPDSLHRFLKLRAFEQTPVWSSAYAPGGEREHWMHQLAEGTAKVYGFTSRIPRLVLIAVTGFLGSFLIQFFHRSDAKKAAAEAEQRKVAAQVKAAEQREKVVAQSPAPAEKVKATATQSPAQSPAKKRKGGKK